MLKALWRKLGVDNMAPTSTGGIDEALRIPETDVVWESVRVLPHITHTGEFHLERLIKLLSTRYGQSAPITYSEPMSDSTLKNLVCFASRIQDQDIQRELLLFYLNCSPIVQEFLRSETHLGK